MRVDHECSACGGTGCRFESTHGGRLRPCEAPCPVCLGTGRISDRMPVADALADAETLRAFQRDPYPPNFLLRTLAPDAYATEHGALRCGVSADLWARGHFYETEWALVDDAAHAARAAFRAVPGLKGE